MGHRIPSRAWRLAIITGLVWTAPAGAQELGHKTLGTLGLRAGSQPDSGLYVIDMPVFYRADEVIDRNGDPIRLAPSVSVNANSVGAQLTFKLPWHSMYMNATIGIPTVRIRVRISVPEASLDRFGFGDLCVQPVRIGWKKARADIVAGYAFYAPTGLYSPREGVNLGKGEWSHQFSLGGAAYFGARKSWNISALSSYNLNQRKREVDITRGDTVQIQGGAGKRLGLFDVGLAGYGLWQVRDDRGADLPDSLRGARTRAFGLGPEVNMTVPRIRGRITVRYCHDIAVRARPSGQILVIGLTIRAARWDSPRQRD